MFGLSNFHTFASYNSQAPPPTSPYARCTPGRRAASFQFEQVVEGGILLRLELCQAALGHQHRIALRHEEMFQGGIPLELGSVIRVSLRFRLGEIGYRGRLGYKWLWQQQ